MTLSLFRRASVEPTPPAPFFLVLPQELRDEIYWHAFGHTKNTFMPISRRSWVARQMQRKWLDRDHPWANKHEVPPFPGCPMKGMVVSKQFYLEAGALWYRELTLLFGSTRHLTGFIHGLRPCFAQAITKVHISGFSLGKTHTSFADLRVCTGLHTLTAEINAIDMSDDKMDFVDDLDSTDLVSLECIQEFAAAKSLRSVTFLPGNECCAETPKEISQWEKNVDALYVFYHVEAGGDSGQAWSHRSSVSRS